MKRRSFIKRSWLASTAAALLPYSSAAKPRAGASDRDDWLAMATRIATPVLDNISRGELVRRMKVDVSPRYDKRDPRVAYLEAFGRLIAGLAPFLNLPDDQTAETKLRQKWREQIRTGIAHGADPQSPDYFFWGTERERQPLVDAAYLAQALLSAPDILWAKLPDSAKGNVVREFTALRRIQPYNSNWLLFAAMIETFLLSVGEKIDAARIDSALDAVTKWYVGDGWYSDGPVFHFDHYNGFVIHAMLCQILATNIQNGRRAQKELDTATRRMQRYALHLERLISPEGTFPLVGRSSTYRVAAFWPLAKLALDEKLPAALPAPQVRSALTAVYRRVFTKDCFTPEGWLTLGLNSSRQRDLADVYSNTGSMYITSVGFVPLGLPREHPFWSAPPQDWTQRKAWRGEPIPPDYYVNY